MIEPKNLWLPPILKGIVGGAVFVIVASFLVSFVLPAWAVSFPIGGYIIDLGALTPWIGIAVTLGIWWDARQAKKKAAEAAASAVATKAVVDEVAKKTDGMLEKLETAARKQGNEEGEAKGLQVGVDTAKTLAEGQRQGREVERASVAAKTISDGTSGPLPVADERTATASERVAEATERSAGAGERVASAAEDASKAKS